MKMTFTSTVCLNDIGPFSTFVEALTDWIPRMIKSGNSHNSLTSSWIEGTFIDEETGNQIIIPLYHPWICEFVNELGLADEDGKLTGVVPSIREVKSAYFDALLERREEITNFTAKPIMKMQGVLS